MNYDDVLCSTCEGRGYVKTSQIPPKDREKLQSLTEQCPACHGKGTIHGGMYKCTECKGTGKRVVEMDGELTYSCQDCNGTGRVKRQ